MSPLLLVAVGFGGALGALCRSKATGFLSGFSTLSTMNYETVELVLGGKRALGAGYLAATYATTLGAAALGFAMANTVM